jgi:hypothetical protein
MRSKTTTNLSCDHSRATIRQPYIMQTLNQALGSMFRILRQGSMLCNAKSVRISKGYMEVAGLKSATVSCFIFCPWLNLSRTILKLASRPCWICHNRMVLIVWHGLVGGPAFGNVVVCFLPASNLEIHACHTARKDAFVPPWRLHA